MIKNLFSIFIFMLYTTAGAQSYFHDEPIFPYQDKHVHASSIVEAGNGDLLACWFYGSGERTADDVLVQGSRLKNGDTNWESVFLMADTPGFPDCNPVLHIDKENRLWLFWIVVQAHRWEQSILKYRISDNYTKRGAPIWSWQDIINLKPGEEFARSIKDGFDKNAKEAVWAEYAPTYSELISEAAKDPAKRQIGWMTRIHPFVLKNGRILLPLYSDGFCLSLVAISDDQGKTWRASLPMVGPGLNQPSIVQKNDGTLLAYMRDEGPSPGNVMLSTSKDNGESWSYAQRTDLPNPSSSLEAIELNDGTWAIVYNDTGDGRYSLAVALSDDEGQSWKWKRHLAFDSGKTMSFSYPSVIQTRDGLIHVTYSFRDGEQKKTIKHAVFNTDWIKNK
jgi:predicted neuraminidase